MPSLSILLAIFLWSSLGVIVRLAGVSETVIIFYSCVVATALQGIIIVAGGWTKYVPDKRMLRYPAMLGCVGLLNTYAFYYSFRHTTIANAVLAHYIAPVLVAFLAAYFLRERATKALVAAIVLSSTGLAVMLGGFSPGSSDTAGIVAGLISGCSYAVLIIMARIYTQQQHPLVMAFVPNVVIMVLLAPFVREFPVQALWSFIVMGVIHSTIAPMLYYWGMKAVTANKTAVLGYLEPVMAILFSMVFLQEVPALKSLAGGGLIIFSGYLTLRGSDKVHPGL